jgi:amino-acid N-acetyltransferase
MKIIKPTLNDIDNMLELTKYYVENAIIINRDRDEVANTIRSYFIAKHKSKIVALVALHIYSQELAEVRSLVVDKSMHNKGIGTKLIKELEKEAKKLGVQKILVLTYQNLFFEKLGYKEIEKLLIPNQKIWADCIKCKHFPQCDEIALIKQI